MAQPWYPSPNPGGQNRRLIRLALVEYVNAQRIQGVGYFYSSRGAQLDFDNYPGGSADYQCLLKIQAFDDSEDRLAVTGPVDRGGKLVHYRVGVQVVHRSYNPDDNQTDEAEADYDRILDALKDCLRGPGRDLGRPDVVLQVGEYPRIGGITTRNNPPLRTDDTVQRDGILGFQITQYIQPNT